LIMENIDIRQWVESASKPDNKEFRQAVHTLLWAVSGSDLLRSNMIIKGGILLAVRFKSTRFTKDVDFSTPIQFNEFDEQTFLHELEKGLTLAVEALGYNLDCRVQSHKLNPPRIDGHFQTLRIKIGYAYKYTPRHDKLRKGNCPITLSVDYSFNESIMSDEKIFLPDGGYICNYSVHELVAEKYRAIIQQASRNRTRRQDVYDIFRLLENEPMDDLGSKQKVMDMLERKAASRALAITRIRLRDDEIKNRSKSEYHNLANEIEEELPAFKEVYDRVRLYYESLPWKEF
jgi:predicted nucleotidyltransferase component of viral defense system